MIDMNECREDKMIGEALVMGITEGIKSKPREETFNQLREAIVGRSPSKWYRRLIGGAIISGEAPDRTGVINT